MRLSTLILLVGTIMSGCGTGAPGPAGWLEFEWPEADSLFQRDPSWVGGDGAYSVDLGDDRVLWLFGDSWIDPTGRHDRRAAHMVSNTLAVQYGYDPGAARAEFFWRTSEDGSPAAFFPDEANRRYWPGHGAVIGDRLLLFLMVVESSDQGLGFEVTDWEAVLVRNPAEDPGGWVMQRLETPSNGRRVIPGSGGVLRHEGFVYAYGSREPGGPHDIYLVRWPEAAAVAGDLTDMQWWQGPDSEWVPGEKAWIEAVPVMTGGQTEFTVHFDADARDFVEIQTTGFGAASITRRRAPSLTGPWSSPDTLFTPAQVSFPGVMIYQGKAHPYLAGAPLVLTYSTNSFDFGDHLTQSWLYYPRFVRVRQAFPERFPTG